MSAISNYNCHFLTVPVLSVTSKDRLTPHQLMYVLLQTIKGGGVLQAVYRGSNDSGDIEEILLNGKQISMIQHPDYPRAIEADTIVHTILYLLAKHTGLHISYDTNGCYGQVTVTEENDQLRIDCNHEYGGKIHSLDAWLQGPVSLDHTILSMQKKLLDGDQVYPPRLDLLGSLLWTLGITSLVADKRCNEEDISIQLTTSQTDHRRLEQMASHLIVNYLDRRKVGKNLSDVFDPANYDLSYRLRNCDFNVEYSVTESLDCYIEAAGSAIEAPHPAEPQRLVIRFMNPQH